MVLSSCLVATSYPAQVYRKCTTKPHLGLLLPLLLNQGISTSDRRHATDEYQDRLLLPSSPRRERAAAAASSPSLQANKYMFIPSHPSQSCEHMNSSLDAHRPLHYSTHSYSHARPRPVRNVGLCVVSSSRTRGALLRADVTETTRTLI
jgi:hypothetical protein